MMAVCPYCHAVYNPISHVWDTQAKPRLTTANHLLHMCDKCATKKGVKYYDVYAS